MKAIGGYFGLECGHQPLYHNGVYVNSGRNALRLIIRTYGIKKLHVPAYTCPSVFDAVSAENCEIVRYELDSRFLPKAEFATDDYVLYNNYFGVCGKNVDALAVKYKNLIVDNAQAFYAKPRGLASFYSPRKFFGLPDGGIAIGEGLTDEGLPEDHSFGRMSHLLKRLDLGAEAGFEDYKNNEDKLDSVPVAKMSNLTKCLLGNVAYARAKERRIENFSILHQALGSRFPFALTSDDVPMVYPYLAEDASLRSRLIKNKIFVARYWPAMFEFEQIVCLPIDQRYGQSDVFVIKDVISQH